MDFFESQEQARKRTGFLPEETRLYEFLTGKETLDFVGQLFGIPREERRRRTDELLERGRVRACPGLLRHHRQ